MLLAPGLCVILAGCPGVIGPGGTVPASGLVIDAPPVNSLRARATVEQWEGGKRIRGHVYIFLEAPDRVRVDAMSPADTPLAILTADENRFALTDVGQGVYYTGPPSACNVARLLGIPMSPRSVLGILTGSPPLIDTGDRSVTWNMKGYHLLTLRGDGDLLQRVQIVSGELGTTALRSVVWSGDAILWDLRFQHRAPVGPGGPALPRTIRIAMPQDERAVEVTYRDIEVNVEIPDDAFVQTPTPGLPVVHVDCEQDEG